MDPQPPGAEVWVFNHKALPAFLHHQPAALPADDVNFVYARLSDYVRMSNHKD